LTDAEVTQITRLSDRIGKPLRLILGFRSMQAGVATIDVYLEPDIVDLPRLNSREFWHALPAHKRRAKSFRQSVEFTAAIVDRAQRARQTASRTRVKKRGR
jgi:uncharacterized NAD(P)/FAD-binding protein YdhS